jgi:hypothetical protein
MSTLRELHDKAMRIAHLAMVARHNQEWERAETLAREASELEAHAAELVPEDQNSEPTRSILYRSAASLAYQCKEFASAQRLIAKGLAGYPPPQVEQELKDLYEQANFENHVKGGLTMKVKQLRMMGDEILHYLHPEIPYSIDARELLILTCATETGGGEYVRQIGFEENDSLGGFGIFQMEIATEMDIYDNFLNTRDKVMLRNKILRLHVTSLEVLKDMPNYSLEYDLGYQIAIARAHYFRFSEKLPDRHNIKGMAEYYKKYWNTVAGKATIEDAITDYEGLKKIMPQKDIIDIEKDYFRYLGGEHGSSGATGVVMKRKIIGGIVRKRFLWETGNEI